MPPIDNISFLNVSSDAATFITGAEALQISFEQLAALQQAQGLDQTDGALATQLKDILATHRRGDTLLEELQKAVIQMATDHKEAVAQAMNLTHAGWQRPQRFAKEAFVWSRAIQKEKLPDEMMTAAPPARPTISGGISSNEVPHANGSIFFPAEFKSNDYLKMYIDTPETLGWKFFLGAIAIWRLRTMALVLPKFWTALGFELGSPLSLFDRLLHPWFEKPLMVPFKLDDLLKNLRVHGAKETETSLTQDEMFQVPEGKTVYFFESGLDGQECSITIAHNNGEHIAIAEVRYTQTGLLQTHSGNNVRLRVFTLGRDVVIGGSFLFKQ